MSHHPKLLRTTRIASLLDGLSFLVLLFIAMPLKYFADMPLAVTHVGRTHGGLFLFLYLCLLLSFLSKTISFRMAALTALAAIIPFAPWFMDRRFRQLESAESTNEEA